MEALPIFLDRLVSPSMAILISVTMVLIFGEIIPQAVFTHYRLPISAYLSPFVRVLEAILFPIAMPMAAILDYFLGPDHPTVYRRAELKELTKRHLITQGDHGTSGTLSQDEVKIMSGVLDMANKEVKDAMHSLEHVFMLSCDQPLDQDCMQSIIASGHSRIPVYVKKRQNVVGVLIVKNIILVDPRSEIKVRDVSKFAVRRIPRVSHRLPLFELLHFFGQGRSHLALVCEEAEDEYRPLEACAVVGVITMEDVIEELIQEEILDETDTSAEVTANLATKFMSKSKLPPPMRPRDPNSTAKSTSPERSPGALGDAGGVSRGTLLTRNSSWDTGAATGTWRTIALTSLLLNDKSATSSGTAVRDPLTPVPLWDSSSVPEPGGRAQASGGAGSKGREAMGRESLLSPLLDECCAQAGAANV
eukprot:Tamp_16062.p1 GENE.Tamp_16062~~Tamp_16062.p1  ORF type:complete len:419 (-),score=63.24 Tamp_16062:34-1290(-)